MLLSPLSAFAKTAKKVYNIGIGQINLAASVYSFAGLVMSLPSNYIIFKLGMRRSMMLSSNLFFAGCSMRLLSTLSIYFVHIGQFICGLGTPLVLNMIGKFAAHWFYKNARSVRGHLKFLTFRELSASPYFLS